MNHHHPAWIPRGGQRIRFLEHNGRKGQLHKNFDHEGLAKILKCRDKWMMTNNDCETVRNLYAGCRIEPVEWSYAMNESKESNEVLITPVNQEGE